MRRHTNNHRSAARLVGAMATLALALTPCAPALAETVGETALIVEMAQDQEQQRMTATSAGSASGCSSPNTGDPSGGGALALAAAGATLAAVGAAARSRRKLVGASADHAARHP